jgi:methionine salvage enolase-phosphatase E1
MIESAAGKAQIREVSPELFIAKNAEALSARERLINYGNDNDESKKTCGEVWAETFKEQAASILSDRISKLPEDVRSSAPESIFVLSGTIAQAMTNEFIEKLNELYDNESAYFLAIALKTDATSTAA